LQALGGFVHTLLRTMAVSGLVIVGGDTAQAVFQALQTSGLVLAGQVSPGIPYGRLLDSAFAGLPAVTKAGGFGEDMTLQDCLTFLQQWTPQ
jgi:uncharacterized protein YgbK (DUF1537 family)